MLSDQVPLSSFPAGTNPALISSVQQIRQAAAQAAPGLASLGALAADPVAAQADARNRLNNLAAQKKARIAQIAANAVGGFTAVEALLPVGDLAEFKTLLGL